MSGRSRVDDEVITLSDNQPAQLQPVEAVKPFKLRISFCYQTKQITISARRFQRAFIKIIKSNGHFIESRAINPLRQWLVDAWPLINEAAQLRTSHFLHRHIFIDCTLFNLYLALHFLTVRNVKRRRITHRNWPLHCERF